MSVVQVSSSGCTNRSLLVVGYDLQSAGGSPASLKPGLWLDLYSGTGSVGIEAMSRGCSQVSRSLVETSI